MAALIASLKPPLSPSALAKKIGTNQPQLSRYLAGKVAEPKRKTLQLLADHFKVDVEAFYRPDLAEKIAQARGLATPPPPPPKKLKSVTSAAGGARFPPTSKNEWDLLLTYRVLNTTYKGLLLADARKYMEAQSHGKRSSQ